MKYTKIKVDPLKVWIWSMMSLLAAGTVWFITNSIGGSQ